MAEFRKPSCSDLDELMRNAELRDELEPYYDESISRVSVHRLPLAVENEYLASMLAWEMAPIVPIYRWFEPELRPPRPSMLNDQDLHSILCDLIEKLYQKRIILDFTDHLSDRELYTIIYRLILPAREKKIDPRNSYLHWDCASVGGDPEIWLRYYASEEDRQAWSETYHQPLPPTAVPPHPRSLPEEPA
jgi:hypothetical protein